MPIVHYGQIGHDCDGLEMGLLFLFILFLHVSDVDDAHLFIDIIIDHVMLREIGSLVIWTTY